MRVNLNDGPWRCARGRRLLLLFGHESRDQRVRLTSSYFTEAFYAIFAMCPAGQPVDRHFVYVRVQRGYTLSERQLRAA